MRILIVGAGSTGGYFGARLALAGRDVTFLVRPGRLAHLASHGLEIISPHGNVTLAPHMVTADRIDRPFDLVILSVKAFSLDAALENLAPAVGPQTMILPVLNGMKHVDQVRARFGAGALIGGVCRIIATLDEQGRIVQMMPMHDLFYGEMDGKRSARILALDAQMQGAGFDARLSDAIEREMWEKWIMLATAGGITCLMRGTVGEVEAAPGGKDFALALLDEIVAVARAAGHPPAEGYHATVTKIVTAKGVMQGTSMYRDLTQGLPIEADQIIGDLLHRAREAKVPTPLLAAVYAHLSVYQNRLTKAG